MVAVTVHTVTIELWKETAFPLCRAIERRWKRNIVSLVSSVIVVMRLQIIIIIIIIDVYRVCDYDGISVNAARPSNTLKLSDESKK